MVRVGALAPGARPVRPFATNGRYETPHSGHLRPLGATGFPIAAICVHSALSDASWRPFASTRRYGMPHGGHIIGLHVLKCLPGPNHEPRR